MSQFSQETLLATLFFPDAIFQVTRQGQELGEAHAAFTRRIRLRQSPGQGKSGENPSESIQISGDTAGINKITILSPFCSQMAINWAWGNHTIAIYYIYIYI